MKLFVWYWTLFAVFIHVSLAMLISFDVIAQLQINTFFPVDQNPLWISCYRCHLFMRMGFRVHCIKSELASYASYSWVIRNWGWLLRNTDVKVLSFELFVNLLLVQLSLKSFFSFHLLTKSKNQYLLLINLLILLLDYLLCYGQVLIHVFVLLDYFFKSLFHWK